MSLLLIEEFAANPDWSRIPEQKLSRAQELINLINYKATFPETSKTKSIMVGLLS